MSKKIRYLNSLILKMKSQDLIKSILNNEEGGLKDLYLRYRVPFLSWFSTSYNVSKEDAQDLFQDTLVIFVMKIQDGKILDINSSVLTLLFSIGKKILQNKVRSDFSRDSRQLEYYHRRDKYDEINEIDDISQLVLSEIDCMGAPCKSILQQYYFKNSSLKEIALSLNYKSAKSVKVQKYRCLKTLKDKIFSNKVK